MKIFKNKKVMIISGTVLLIVIGISSFMYIQHSKKQDSFNKLSITLTDNEINVDVLASVFDPKDYIKESSTKVEIKSNVDTNTVGKYEVKYVAEDKYKQSKSQTLVVNVIDTESPILAVEPLKITLEYGSEYDVLNGVTVIDNYDKDLTNESITVESNLDTKTAGTYTITYTVKDSSDNETSATREIIVNAEVKAVATNSSSTSSNKNNSTNKNTGGSSTSNNSNSSSNSNNGSSNNNNTNIPTNDYYYAKYLEKNLNTLLKQKCSNIFYTTVPEGELIKVKATGMPVNSQAAVDNFIDRICSSSVSNGTAYYTVVRTNDMVQSYEHY